MIQSGDYLGRMKNGNPVYAVSTPTGFEEQPTTDGDMIALGVLAVGVVGVAAMMGVMMGENTKRKPKERAMDKRWGMLTLK